MSAVAAERAFDPGASTEEGMPGGIALSAGMHAMIGLLILVGLPTLFRPPPQEDQPIAVQLVMIAPETRATRPNPNAPRADAKPDVTPNADIPVPKPDPKPEPPKPAPTPPPSAAAAPPPTPEPPPPEPQKQPEKVETPPPPPPPPPKPDIKPEPKPEPPKPEEAQKPDQPKPPPVEAPKPRAKPAPPQPAKTETPPAPKADPNAFASLLKNLTKQETAPPQEAPPQRQPRQAAARASSQPNAPLGSQLTASEMDLIRRQISECWNPPAGARDARDLVIDIKVAANPDGSIAQANIVDQGKMGDPFYRAAAESALRAVKNPRCTPLRLPPEKYDVWKSFILSFNPKDLL